jgi:hypothetical protein
MYKIYLKKMTERGSEVLTESRTTTASPIVAESAFRELISRRDLIGKKYHAVLSLDNRQLMYHRFDRHEGQSDYIATDAEIRLIHD